MFTGTTIDQLIQTVEKTEQQARPLTPAETMMAPGIEAFPQLSTYVCQWPMEHVVVGVA
jgi:hypothetical protein